MQQNTNTDNKDKSPEAVKKQQQTDPNLTELKGLTDPSEKLEPEGTDNKFDDKDSKKDKA